MKSFLLRILVVLVGLYVIYVACVGLFSLVANQRYNAPAAAVETDRDKAVVMSEALVQGLDEELNSRFGWIANDLFPVPQLIDNKTNYQRGIIYATRSASDILAQTISRLGDKDTISPLLDAATAKFFAYADNVWGWWYLYDTESKYKAGIKNWRLWAASVGDERVKKPAVFNMTTGDEVAILNWSIKIMNYMLGILNDTKVGHFSSDDVVYYVKGIAHVVDNVLQSMIACDSNVITRGGEDNVDECVKRFSMISRFNPIYVVAGSYGVGDGFWPNHIAALARHVDIVSNRLEDIRNALEK